MFINGKDIKEALLSNNIPFENIEYISIGVMTDKFVYISNGKKYIARCYPENRSYLAEAEMGYLQAFRDKGILCPKPIQCINVGQYQCLIYEYLEGKMLSDVYPTMNKEQRDMICREIADNYNRISEISCNGYGRMIGFGQFSHQSKQEFVTEVQHKAEDWLANHPNVNLWAKDIICKFKEEAKENIADNPVLVWSDLSKDNIILNKDGHLAGFVDFEGLMSADANLGIGYLQARENNSDFAKRLISQMSKKDIGKIDYYAKQRYLCILPYSHLSMPNGEPRQNLNEYLPYLKTICI